MPRGFRSEWGKTRVRETRQFWQREPRSMSRSQNEQTFARFRYRSRVDRSHRLYEAWAVLLALVVILLAREAHAGAADEAAAQQWMQQAMTEDYTGGNFTAARQKVTKAIERCNRGCSPATKAQLYTAL